MGMPHKEVFKKNSRCRKIPTPADLFYMPSYEGFRSPLLTIAPLYDSWEYKRYSLPLALMNVHQDSLNVKKTPIDITLVNDLNRIFREFV